jgi:hypothetical protein
MMQTYVLSLADKPEGVFSVVDNNTGEHVIPIFEDAEDAERYAIQMVEVQNGPSLQILEIEKEIIVAACEEKDQRYAIITIDDFIIPPC